MTEEKTQPTIVLAHGAWCDGSIWTQTLISLLNERHRAHAVQLPLSSFEKDVAAVTALLDQVDGPVLLVGHSYAGAVITVAGTHPKVSGLAYIAAFAPDQAESVTTISSAHPGQVQLDLIPDANGFLWLTKTFATSIAQDVDEVLIDLMVAVQKPTNASVFGGQIESAAWRQKPCSYLLTTEDRGLSPEAQRAFAARMNARVEEVAASHFVVLSQPERITEFIRSTLRSTSKD